MKILMLGWEWPPHISGGLGIACHGLCKGISEYDEDVAISFVLPSIFGDEERDKIELIGINDENFALLTDSGLTHRNSSRIDRRGSYAPDLHHEVERYTLGCLRLIDNLAGFDVIHAHDWLTYKAGIELKRISGKPLVSHVHSTEYDRARGNGDPKKHEAEKIGLDNADKIITVSEYTRKTVVKMYEQPANKICAIHNGADTFFSSTIRGGCRRDKLKTVAFIGRITYQKGPEYFVRAAYKILRKNPDVRFVMAGGGNLLNMMRMLARSLGIADRVVFPGFLSREDVRVLLSQSDVYVMPSVSEPFGISAVEAMLAGVPTVVSKQSGVAEVVESVVKVDCWDLDQLAESINALLEDADWADRLAMQARREAEKLTWKSSAKLVVEQYVSLAMVGV